MAGKRRGGGKRARSILTPPPATAPLVTLLGATALGCGATPQPVPPQPAPVLPHEHTVPTVYLADAGAPPDAELVEVPPQVPPPQPPQVAPPQVEAPPPDPPVLPEPVRPPQVQTAPVIPGRDKRNRPPVRPPAEDYATDPPLVGPFDRDP